MHYDFSTILAMAEDKGNGYKALTLDLEIGDTAYAPGTTKYQLRAHGTPARVEYHIHPEGVQGYTSGKVGRILNNPNG